ncbi:hypothetical protein ACM7M6_19580, partial [Pseudomonas aeruginosa]
PILEGLELVHVLPKVVDAVIDLPGPSLPVRFVPHAVLSPGRWFANFSGENDLWLTDVLDHFRFRSTLFRQQWVECKKPLKFTRKIRGLSFAFGGAGGI